MARTSSSLPHLRSISLPSRLNPTNSSLIRIKEELRKFSKWEGSKPLSQDTIRSVTIQNDLNELAELYRFAQDILQSSSSATLGFGPQVVVEEALDASTVLLDACNLCRDTLMTMRERIQDLQSAMRRNRGEVSSVQVCLRDYFRFRKDARKNISKCLKELKTTSITCERRRAAQDVFLAADLLREVSGISSKILQSVLSFLDCDNVMSKRVGGWSIMAMFVPEIRRREGKTMENEVGSVDSVLSSLDRRLGKKKKSELLIRANNGVMDEDGKLESLISWIDRVDVGLNCIFKCLVRNRVELLNASL
ncbi:uncharacterized protein LOC124939595 [Impatiens glandulifera]|uniref:uncharacterized protein LOC124939595 n=1 Tax=Impatiens glandulifera TaxID=253017 RepID=UPI001FB14A59|nr:uncharacterized protein LOC124939595 [Impatiens glandulifera]